MKTILLVEDDASVLAMNRAVLAGAGYAVLEAATLRQARERLAQHTVDLVLLDVLMPDGSGLDFCGEVRAATTAPVLFLTVQDRDKEIVDGLAAGGDDYITKPYNPAELLARIGAALRRVALDRQAFAAGDTLDCGPLALDVVARRAYLRGEDILLSPKEFALLLLLVRRAGQYVSKDELYRAVWKQPTNGDARAVQVQMSRLRKKLESAGTLRISAIRGEGYCFECDGPQASR